MTFMDNIVIADGVHSARFRIRPDQVQAMDTNQSYSLDAAAWHTYRITTLGTTFNLYVDEQSTPAITGALTTATTTNQVWFGSGASAATQTIWFDYLRYNAHQVLPPGQGNGGVPLNVTCTIQWNTDRATIDAYSVPFNRLSSVRNKIQFTLKDVAGNVGFSPIYTVRIGRLTASDHDGDHDVDQADFGPLQACLSGPGVAFQPGCENSDFDMDGDVDSNDVQLFVDCFSGPGVRADQDCTD